MSKTKILSNKQVVVNYLKSNKSITDIIAADTLGVRRLSDVIFRLRNEGFSITTVMHTNKNRRGKSCNYGEYILKSIPNTWIV